MPLSDAKIRKAKAEYKTYKLFDEKGLYLLVNPNNTKYWRHKYRFSGKEQTGSYGVYPEVSLAEARTKRDDTRSLLRNGENPSLEKRKAKISRLVNSDNTFAFFCDDWLKLQKVEWNPRHYEAVKNSLATNVLPYVGSLPIRSITALELRAVLEVVQNRGARDMASRLRQRCSGIFRHAMALGAADNDPADALKVVIKAPKGSHFAALDFKALPELLEKVSAYPAHPQTHLAFWLLLLTLVRTNELIGAKWDEIDVDEKVWHIPKERVKLSRPHYVPLSSQVLVLIERLRSFTGNRDHLFAGVRTPRKPMSNLTVLRMIERVGFKGKQTGHGFRTLGSTELNESGEFSPDAIERQLSHEDKDHVRAAYNRAEYMAERRRMMQWWSDRVVNLTEEEFGSKIS